MGTNGIVKFTRTEQNDGNGKFGGVIFVQMSPSTLEDDACVTWLMEGLEACSMLYPHAKFVVDLGSGQSVPSSLTDAMRRLSERVKARGGELKVCASKTSAHEPFAYSPAEKVGLAKAVA